MYSNVFSEQVVMDSESEHEISPATNVHQPCQTAKSVSSELSDDETEHDEVQERLDKQLQAELEAHVEQAKRNAKAEGQPPAKAGSNKSREASLQNLKRREKMAGSPNISPRKESVRLPQHSFRTYNNSPKKTRSMSKLQNKLKKKRKDLEKLRVG